jgi:predicted 2-oxoglutarate/Fe(II)-dependent dioxygenase YbiX
LVPMLRHESPDSHLSLAFQAVSLASLANRPSTRGRAIFPQAVAQYTKALKAVNLALQNPTQQKTDQTLAAILMLGFFETIASETSNASAWYSHVDGAVQLVKMRGKKQLRTKVGYSLFVSVRNQMVRMSQKL